MSKGLNAAKAHKLDKPRSAKKGRAQGWGVKSTTADGHYKKSRDKKVSAGNHKDFGDIDKMTRGNKSKSGCLPKVFTMLLLFTFVGAYFILST